MDKKVRITLKTTQIQDGEANELKFDYEGMYFQKGNHFYIMYEEPVAGTKEVIKNRIKFSEGFVEVVKRGALSATLYFEVGQNYRTEYHTPFGKTLLQMETCDYHMKWVDENKVKLGIKYSLSGEQGKIADCRMEIKVESC